MSTKTYKIIVAYDGYDFQGWQSQPHKKTIENTLRDRFKTVFGESISIRGASRTDARVHAFGQVATFTTHLSLDPNTVRNAWNNSLPSSIIIRSINEVHDFDPRKNVISKTYYYHLFLKRPMPFIARYGWHYPFIDTVDIPKFAQGLQLYIGEHDFKSFCKIETERSTVRTIHSITIEPIKKYKALRIAIKGSSFLHFQIRRMIGCALDVGRDPNLSVEYITTLLEKPGTYARMFKAEAHGLLLHSIEYNDKK